MARNAELIRAILRQPEDDTVRLVYADWLDENDDPKHAELIRVQCELAKKTCPPKRKKQLQKSEAELLANPGFHLAGQRPFRYTRGFIEEICTLRMTRTRVEVSTFDPDSIEEFEPFFHPLRAADLPVLDWALRVSLDLCSLPKKEPKWGDPLMAGCLRRVTSLDCEYAGVDEASLGWLQKCPHFESVAHINFDNASAVPLGAIEELYLSPALPHVISIHIDGEGWLAGDGMPVEDEHIAGFIARIGAAEKASRLTYFQLNRGIGPEAAQALLDAPYLKPSGPLCMFMHRGLNKATKAALKKKFGKSLKM